VIVLANSVWQPDLSQQAMKLAAQRHLLEVDAGLLQNSRELATPLAWLATVTGFLDASLAAVAIAVS